ncbi:hypothetical protein AHF37_09508, partial [Paragonimus kellicotti]
FVDSFCFNGNKLLRVHFDCTIIWFADHRVITKAFEEEAVYLGNDFQGMPEYRPPPRLLQFVVCRLHGTFLIKQQIRLTAFQGKNGLTQELNDRLLNDGRVFMVPGSIEDSINQESTVYFLRFVASPQTMLEDVHFTYKVISEATETVLFPNRAQELRDGVIHKY